MNPAESPTTMHAEDSPQSSRDVCAVNVAGNPKQRRSEGIAVFDALMLLVIESLKVNC